MELKTRTQVIEEQANQVSNELIAFKLHRDFKELQWKDKLAKAKKKEDKEMVAHQKEKDLNPLIQNIALKEDYLKWLKSLATE